MKPNKTIILSLGGSIIVPDEINTVFLKKFKELILSYLRKGMRFVIICGGGKTCRKYQEAAKQMRELNNEELDEVGIAATKLNAEFVRQIFRKYAYAKIIDNYSTKIKTNKKIIIGAGWKPGCSTDYDAVLAAKQFNAKIVVNMFDLEFVYDKDPKKYHAAKHISKISWNEFIKRICGRKWDPGRHVPFDPKASLCAKKAKIKVVMLKGTNLENFRKFLDGKEFKGTIIG